MKASRPIVIALFCLLSAALGESAAACSCGGWPSPCAAYAGAGAVFVGRVTKVEPPESQADENYEGKQTAYVQVEEASKGAAAGAEFVFKQPGHNCGTLRGVLLYADGRPVAEESVAFRVEGQGGRYEETQHARTDEQGRFALKVLRETGGTLTGSMYVFAGAFAAECPEVGRLIRKSGGRMYNAESKPVRIEPGGDAHGIKLSLPFPYCPLAEKNRD